MERSEEAEAKISSLRADRAAAEEELARLIERRDTALREIDDEAGATSSARTAVAKDIPDDLLALYEKLRAQFGGVGAAKLFRGTRPGRPRATHSLARTE